MIFSSKKLKVAVAVAHGCHQALERERMGTREETKRLKFHLLLGREALKKSIDNPLVVRILHTPEEAHEFIAEKERKQKDDKWRQFSIEEALKRDHLSRHKEQTWMEQRDQERLKRLPKLRPKTRQDAEKEALARETDLLKRVHKPSQLQDHSAVNTLSLATNKSVRLTTRACATCVSTAL
jgi:hypothetical protein